MNEIAELKRLAGLSEDDAAFDLDQWEKQEQQEWLENLYQQGFDLAMEVGEKYGYGGSAYNRMLDKLETEAERNAFEEGFEEGMLNAEMGESAEIEEGISPQLSKVRELLKGISSKREAIELIMANQEDLGFGGMSLSKEAAQYGMSLKDAAVSLFKRALNAHHKDLMASMNEDKTVEQEMEEMLESVKAEFKGK